MGINFDVVVDGSTIAIVKISNIGESSLHKGLYQYRFEVYELPDNKYEGNVMHVRNKGYLRLIELVMKEAQCEKRYQEAEAKGDKPGGVP